MLWRSWLDTLRSQCRHLCGPLAGARRRTATGSALTPAESLEPRLLLTTIDLADLNSGGTTIFGAGTGDQSAVAVSNAGDVNGDGFDDLVIGAWKGDALGNAKANAGETYIVFGGPSLPATIDLANLGTAGVIIYGADADDQSGVAVSGAGDVNDDGFDDVLIGAWTADGPDNARSDAGESYVIFGGAALPATIDLASLGNAGITIIGADGDDRSGWWVSGAGDINGDGIDDLVVGATGGDAVDEAKDGAGETYVIFGSQSLPATIDLATPGSAGIRIYGADVIDFAGRSLAPAGDVNGDGFDDLLIGATGGNGSDNTTTDAGETYVIFGGAALPATIDLADLGSDGITIFGGGVNDLSGHSVSSAGDVNGDGFDDLLIGAYLANGSGNAKPDSGESYVIFGGASLPATIELATLGSAGVTIFGANSYDYSGGSVASVGDVNGDGFDDLLIGAFGGDGTGNNKTDSGETYLIFGGASLPATIDLANLGTAGLLLVGVNSYDYSGYSVSRAGDVNGDGIDDLLIGAYLADGPGNNRVNAGESYVVFGRDFAANADPVFTSSATPSVAENETAVITVVATDADLPPQTVTYTISGGADQGKFSITSAGVLKFVAPPDFENPTDAGTDNVYEVQVTADDGNGGQAVQNLSVTVTNLSENAPVLHFSGPAVTWTKKQPPVIVLPQVTVDGPNTDGPATLTITMTAVGKKKPLDALHIPSFAALGTSSTGLRFSNGQLTLQIALNVNTSAAAIQAFLQGITFSTKGKGLSVPTRTLNVSLARAGTPTSTVTQTINVHKK